MTVIAYSRRHQTMAADSLCVDEVGMRLTNCQKLFRLKNGAIFGAAGDAEDRALRDLLGKATPKKLPSREQLSATKSEVTGILVFPKGQVFTVYVGRAEYANEGEWIGGITPITDDVVSVGHGQQYAYGVMDHGGSPVDAVRITCRRDTLCALPVQTMTLVAKKAAL